MLKKLRAWLYAKLRLKCEYTIPNTEMRITQIVNRVTGQTHVDWSVPAYIIQAERQRLVHLHPGTQIRVTILVPRATEVDRAFNAQWN
jgi:hypothetical protein